MKIIKKLVSIISAVIFVVCLLLLAVVLMTPKGANGSKVVNIAGYSVMSVISPSMDPEYKIGDIVIIKKTDASELKKGDVITFSSLDPVLQGGPVTHRINDIIVEDGKVKFETKGDANKVVDSDLVTEDKIYGKVQFKIPSVGKAVNFLQTNRTAFFLIVILPMLFIMAFEVKDIILIARNGDDDESEKNSK